MARKIKKCIVCRGPTVGRICRSCYNKKSNRRTKIYEKDIQGITPLNIKTIQ